MRVIKSGVIKDLGSSGQIDDQWVCYSSMDVMRHNNQIWLYCDAWGDNTYPRIELLISKDGENFINKGIVIPLGAAGTGSNLVVSYATLSINKINNQFFLYTYTQGTATGINLYISKDGMNFIEKNFILKAGITGQIDDLFTFGLKFISYQNKIFGYYAGADSNYLYNRICGVVSQDGMNFTKEGVFLPYTSLGTIADASVAYWSFSPFIWHNKIWMLFSACPGGGIEGILALYCSDDGCNFVARGEIIVPRGGAGEVDTVTNAAGQCVLPIDGTHIAIYSGCREASFPTRGMRTILEL